MNPQEEFNWQKGKEARDEGMSEVLGNTPVWWRENCYRLMRAQPAEMEVPFTGEDFCRYAQPIIGSPHHPNAWGAVWNAGIRKGFIFPTGLYRAMQKKRSHARFTMLYVWGIR